MTAKRADSLVGVSRVHIVNFLPRRKEKGQDWAYAAGQCAKARRYVEA